MSVLPRTALVSIIIFGIYSFVTMLSVLHYDACNCQHDRTGSARIDSDWKIDDVEAVEAIKDGSDLATPFWWMEEDEDKGWFERTFVPDGKTYYAVRKLPEKVKEFFNPLCGHSRFNETNLPDVSVILTTQNEISGWTTISVHSIIARTPPHLLNEVIIIDDNGMPPEVRGADINNTELDELERLPKVKVFRNVEKKGCAASRLVGARAAKGAVLMFVDSHVEMLHSTWYQHLLVPIVENPRTVATQSLENIDDGGGKEYKGGGGNSLGVIGTRALILGGRAFGREVMGNQREREKDLARESHLKHLLGPDHCLRFDVTSSGAWEDMMKGCSFGAERILSCR